MAAAAGVLFVCVSPAHSPLEPCRGVEDCVKVLIISSSWYVRDGVCSSSDGLLA